MINFFFNFHIGGKWILKFSFFWFVLSAKSNFVSVWLVEIVGQVAERVAVVPNGAARALRGSSHSLRAECVSERVNERPLGHQNGARKVQF